MQVNESVRQFLTNKRKPKWLMYGVFVLLLSAISAFTYEYYALRKRVGNQRSIENLRTYNNEEYGFSFDYPQNWKIDDVQGPDGPGISLSNIVSGHSISIQVWGVTGFGYCYGYGEIKKIGVGGKIAETADGAGTSSKEGFDCDQSGLGNTYVLIPLDKTEDKFPRAQTIHISYDYPLKEIGIAKSNLDQVLATFKFTK